MNAELFPELDGLYTSAAWDELLKRSSDNNHPEILYYKVIFTKALALQQLKKFDEAIEVYNSLYSFNAPSLREIDYNIGLCHYHLGNLPKASEFLKKYLLSNPQHQHIYLHLCKVLFVLKAYEEINEACEKADVWRVKHIPYYIWATALYKLKKEKKAHNVLIINMSENPKKSEDWLLLGKVLERCGYFWDAGNCYERSLHYNMVCKKAKKHMKKIRELKKKSFFRPEEKHFIELDDPITPKMPRMKSRNCEELACVVF